MLFGGIGGVMAIFYSLLKYISQRTYDPEHNFRYFVKPFMGMIMGLVVYTLVFIVMRIFNFVPATLGEANAEKVQIFLAITWLLSLMVGFKENLAVDFIDNLMKRLFRRDKTKNRDEQAIIPTPYQPSP